MHTNGTGPSEGQERVRHLCPSPDADLGRFARGLRHQLGNVLTPVVAFGELLADDPELPERALEDVAAINQAAQRGQRLVDTLLTSAGFARVEHAPIAVLDLAELLEGAWPDGGARARVVLAVDQGRRSTTEQAEQLVHADVRALSQIIDEVASNSTRAGAVVVTISLGIDGDRCVLRLDDDGHGARVDDLPELTKPYVSTQHSSARGLGLSVVNGLAHALGGDLTLESAAGAGFAVEVSWPVHHVAAEAADDPDAGAMMAEQSAAEESDTVSFS